VPHRFFSVGKWQEIVCKATADGAPAKMIRDPRRSEAPNQRLEFREIVLPEGIGSSDIEGHAMKNDWRQFAGLLQYLQRPTARDHEVLRNYFEPVYASRPVQHVGVVNGPKTDAVT
jgi:hypothetical protein